MRASLSHPAIGAARAQAQAASLDVDVARREKWPTLSVQSDVSGSRQYGTVSLYQPLWTGGRIEAQVRGSEVQQRAAETRTREARDGIAMRVIGAWQTEASAYLRVELLQKQLDRLQRFQSMMQRRVDAQMSPRSDLELVQARVALTNVELQAAQSAQATAQAQLRLLAPGRRSPEEAPVDAAALDAMTLQFAQQLPTDLATAVEEAEARSPALQRVMHEGEAASVDLDARRAARMPTIYVKASHQVGTHLPGGSTGVFLGVQYSPGAGFSSEIAARSAEERVRAQAEALQAARGDLSESIVAEWQTYLQARAKVTSLAAAVDGATSVRESYERQFTAGRRTWLDLINSERELSSSEIAREDARVQAAVSAYRLLTRLERQDWQQGLNP